MSLSGKMRFLRTEAAIFVFIVLMMVFFISCRRSGKASQQPVTIVFGACSGFQEVYQKEIIPAFQDYWLKKAGQKVEFKEFYTGSGLQVQAIIAGFEADVVALSLGGHIKMLEEAGLVSHSWRSQTHRGIVARSVVAFGLREGNPKDIFTWEGLTHQGVGIIHADPKTSGTAQWVMKAIYGAGLKLSEGTSGNKNLQQARHFLKEVEKKVMLMDRTIRAASHTFNRGTGDVLISSEHEIKLQQRLGCPIEMIIPIPTILIEHPVALVDKNVDKHGRRQVVEAFVKFLWTRKVQEAFADYGFRSVDNRAFEKYVVYFSKLQQLFNTEYLTGWEIGR